MAFFIGVLIAFVAGYIGFRNGAIAGYKIGRATGEAEGTKAIRWLLENEKAYNDMKRAIALTGELNGIIKNNSKETASVAS
jgi:hypothetical protein